MLWLDARKRFEITYRAFSENLEILSLFLRFNNTKHLYTQGDERASSVVVVVAFPLLSYRASRVKTSIVWELSGRRNESVIHYSASFIANMLLWWPPQRRLQDAYDSSDAGDDDDKWEPMEKSDFVHLGITVTYQVTVLIVVIHLWMVRSWPPYIPRQIPLVWVMSEKGPHLKTRLPLIFRTRTDFYSLISI